MNGRYKITIILTFAIALSGIVNSKIPIPWNEADELNNYDPDAKLPVKIDLGIVVDGSSQMGLENFNYARDEVISGLLEYLSVSSGTTRVALYTIGNKSTKHFSFKKHVNRECLLKSISKIKFIGQPRVNKEKLKNIIEETFEELWRYSKEVDNQRRIYLFFTNNIQDGSTLKGLHLNLHEEDQILFVLPKVATLKENEELYYSAEESDRFKYTAKESGNRKTDDDDIVNKDNNFVTALPLHRDSVSIILKILNIPNKSRAKCIKDGRKVIDECERHCTCQNGTLADCYRIRKEFTSMTSFERKRYLKTYKTLTTKSPYKEIYERFVFMHYKYFCWGVHGRNLFLPWHRWFLSKMEDLLKQIDCRVTIPYWDWSYVSEDPWNRTNLWRSTDDGLGSNGNIYKGYCVQNGIFRESEWTTPYWEDPMDIILSSADQLKGDIEDQRGHLSFCLRRAFKGHTPSYNSVQRTLELPPKRFIDFDIQMRHNFHDRVHNIIGGTMCTHYAGDTPEFFLHHSFLDKIWFTWQEKSIKHKWVHFLQLNTTKMLGADYTQYELTDSHNLPRCMKVKYEKFPLKTRDKRDIDNEDIDSMSRRTSKYWEKYLTESWEGTFPNCSHTKKEKKRAKYLHKILDGPFPQSQIKIKVKRKNEKSNLKKKLTTKKALIITKESVVKENNFSKKGQSP